MGGDLFVWLAGPGRVVEVVGCLGIIALVEGWMDGWMDAELHVK